MENKTKTWVLLRGLAREAGHWGSFVKEMQSSRPGDKIITLDLPGAGEYHRENCPTSISSIVNFMREKLASKVNQENFYLVSVSLGGMISLEWMRQHPSQIQGAVLINSSVGNLSPFYHRLRWEVYPEFFGKTIFYKGQKREEAILQVISNKRDVHKEVAAEWADIATKRPLNPKNVLRQIFAAANFRLLDPPQKPCLFIVSHGDNLVSPKCTLNMHQKFGGDLVEHSWGGHDLTLDDGPWVAQKINEWVQKGL